LGERIEGRTKKNEKENQGTKLIIYETKNYKVDSQSKYYTMQIVHMIGNGQQSQIMCRALTIFTHHTLSMMVLSEC
jgi:hypothetical protein